MVKVGDNVEATLPTGVAVYDGVGGNGRRVCVVSFSDGEGSYLFALPAEIAAKTGSTMVKVARAIEDDA